MIELKALSRTYPGTPPVIALADATLTITEGEWVSIVGPSGAGKSTLLSLMGLLDAPSSGRYLLEGMDVSSLKSGQRAELRSNLFGFVFQAFHMVDSRTVLGNVELGLVYARVPRRERTARAKAALTAVGLGHRLDAPVPTLSGGEKQRAAIARAIASEARVLLCDEPTGNLDDESGQLVLHEMAKARDRGITVVVITHDQRVAALGDRIIEVRDGFARPGDPR